MLALGIILSIVVTPIVMYVIVYRSIKDREDRKLLNKRLWKRFHKLIIAWGICVYIFMMFVAFAYHLEHKLEKNHVPLDVYLKQRK